MSIIIPYDEDLFGNVGAFISPEGKIFHVKDDHESFCENFLFNNNTYFNKKIQLEKLHRMLDAYYKGSPRKSLSDFMVLALNFDKVEILLRNTISTSTRQPHIRFYNYYLMDWNINVYEKLCYHPESNQFEFIYPYPVGLDSEDTDAFYEIEDIKSKTLVRERNLFFK